MKPIQINTYWDWYEFGLCLKFEKLRYHPDYKYQLDMHLLFFHCWINIVNK